MDEDAQLESGPDVSQTGPPGLAVGGFLVWSTTYLVFCVLILGIVPRFKEIFDNMGVTLPWITMFFLDLSEWFLAIPFLAAVGVGSYLPLRLRPTHPRLTQGYWTLAIAGFLGVGLAVLSVFLPIFEMQNALGK